MAKSLRIVIALAVIALGYWGWRVLFPSPEQVIRSRLAGLARTASFGPDQGLLVKAYNAGKLADFFTTNAVLHLDVSGYGNHSLEGRVEIQQAAAAVRQQFRAMKVELLDVNLKLAPDKQSADADLTGRATVPDRNDMWVQEFDFKLKKVDGHWLIDRVDTVKTL